MCPKSFLQHLYETPRPELIAKCRLCKFSKATLTETPSQTKIFKPSYHSKAYKNTFSSHSVATTRLFHRYVGCALETFQAQCFARLPMAVCIIVTGSDGLAGGAATTDRFTRHNRSASGQQRALDKGIFLGRSERPLL